MLGSFSRACWSLSRYQSTQAEGADAVMQSEGRFSGLSAVLRGFSAASSAVLFQSRLIRKLLSIVLTHTGHKTAARVWRQTRTPYSACLFRMVAFSQFTWQELLGDLVHFTMHRSPKASEPGDQFVKRPGARSSRSRSAFQASTRLLREV